MMKEKLVAHIAQQGNGLFRIEEVGNEFLNVRKCVAFLNRQHYWNTESFYTHYRTPSGRLAKIWEGV